MFISPLKISPLASKGIVSILTTFVWIDQSNGLGTEAMAGLQAEYVGANPDVQIWTGAAYATIDSTANNNQFPVASRNNKFGPKFSFSKKMADFYGEVVYMNTLTIGGTYLAIDGAATDWNAASVAEYYDDIITQITTAGDADNIGAIIIGPKESDAASAPRSGAYDPNLTAIINGFRTLIGRDVLIILPLINDNTKGGGFEFEAQVRTAQCRVAATLANVITTNPNSLELAVDQLHYTATGFDDLGGLISDIPKGITQAQRFVNLLSFEDATSQAMRSPKINIDTSIFTGVRPTYAVRCIYKIDHNAGPTNAIFGLFDGNLNRTIVVYGSITGDKVRATTYSSTGSVRSVTANPSTAIKGKWVDALIVFDGSLTTIYMDGADQLALNQINNTDNYGQGTLGTDYMVGNFDGIAPTVGNYFCGKMALLQIIKIAPTAGNASTLAGVSINGQIQPLQTNTVIDQSDIIDIINDNYSWNGSNVIGDLNFVGENMTIDNVTIDSPS